MASTTDMNIVIGQGNAVKEVHNVRKQNLELNQQFVAQQTEQKKKEDRVTVQEFESPQRTGIEEEEKEDKRNKKSFREDQKDSKEKQSSEESDQSEGSLIDIKV
ncbi:MAG TPA: hypothetical protein VMW89_14270 [Desulfatiglandales bacterium]|jgi:hypothetical protein|nr:hypothetical protein [Desulfatiglandales bacterium]